MLFGLRIAWTLLVTPPALALQGVFPAGKAPTLLLAAGTWAEGMVGSPYVAGERPATPWDGFTLLSNSGAKAAPKRLQTLPPPN